MSSKPSAPHGALSRLRSQARYLSIGLIGLALLSSCAVGPNFREPAAPETTGYRHDALPQATVAPGGPTGDAQRFLTGTQVPERWWTTFANDELNRRVEQALTHSPTIASAQAALRQAQENAGAARGPLFPAVDAKAGANRQNTINFGNSSGASTSSPYTLYNASVGVSYTLDLFGGVHRNIEAQSALADYQQYLLEGTYLTLAANVATTSFLEASLREQIRATEEIAGLYHQQLELTNKQVEIGVKSEADALVAQSQLATANAQLPGLRKALSQTQTQLATYLGQLPAESQLTALNLDELTLPHDIPVALPSELVRRRPDIRAAEAQLHQASARVGIATANLFPQISLSASYGSQALDSGDLFGSGTAAWSLGLNLLQPIFRGGTLRAQKRASEAGLDKAAADYRSTVLTAFQNVADSLRALELDAEALQAQTSAQQATGKSLELVRIQYQEGAANYLQVLDATRQYQNAIILLIQARAARLSDTAALYAAFGGGWQGDGAPTADAAGAVSP
ncbi:MAG: efflux transporter outer membrane subunit [Dokdonella sp.]